MAGGCRKFFLLMWKNWTLQLRNPRQTIAEILVPVLFCSLLYLVRSAIKPEVHEEVTSYVPFETKLPQSTNDSQCTVDFRNFNSVAWSPNHKKLASVMDEAAKRLEVEAVGFNNSKDLINNLTSPSAPLKNFLAAVIFDDSLAADSTSELPQSITMTIRFPSELRPKSDIDETWQTNLLFPVDQQPGPREKDAVMGGKPYYFCQGFLSLQESVSLALVTNIFSISWDDLPKVYLQRYPHIPYIDDIMYVVMSKLLPTIITCSFLYSSVTMAKAITGEKETQLKETLKIVGLPGWLHWTAWFFKNLTFLSITCFLILLLMKAPSFTNWKVTVFTNSDTFILYTFLLLYVTASITFSFMVSILFSKAKTAATVTGLLWFISYMPFNWMEKTYWTSSLVEKLLLCLLHNTAMSYGFKLFLMSEATGVGMQWRGIWEPASQGDHLFLGHVILMLIADAVIYMLITLYIEAVFPGDYGIPLPWNYFLKKSYWCGNENTDLDYKNEITTVEAEYFEIEPSDLRQGVQTRNLQKVFHNYKVAVSGLNLNLYEGQITVLLGHNGAGKTTTMSMLTGMIPPTTGTAIINGYDIRKNTSAARDSLGYCPQHNVLYDKLTVKEHLYFFGKLRGLRQKELKNEINKFLQLLNVKDKSNCASEKLSGGMKRKLSVAVALCGNSKVVFLDEPTAGMDVSARRSLWDLLSAEKKNRTILLTTHYMDEADILGDRIAIMADGKLCCCGSSFFLKKKFGAGYHLIVEKGPNCDSKKVLNLLRKYIKDLKTDQDMGSELSYILNEEKSSIFEDMLKELENNQQSLGILSYGISMATMEEVFMRAGKIHFENEVIRSGVPEGQGSEVSDHERQSSSHAKGCSLKCNQFKGMVVKKVLYMLRNWKLFILLSMIPTLLLLLTLFGDSKAPNEPLPLLKLNLESYGLTYVLTDTLSNAGDSARKLYNWYKSLLPEEWLVDLGNTDVNISTAFLYIQNEDIRAANEKYIVGADFGSNESKDVLVGWFSGQPFHSAPVSLNLLMNALLRSYSQNSSWSIEVANYPLPYSQSSQVELIKKPKGSGAAISHAMWLGFSIFIPFFIMFYIKERVCKFKLLQFVSGADIFVFWFSSFVCDALAFMICIIAFVLTLAALQLDGYTTFNKIGLTAVLLILFAWSSIPLIYLVSFLFSMPEDGYSNMTIIFFFTGIVYQLFIIFEQLKTNVIDNVKWILLSLPMYNLEKTVSQMEQNEKYQELCIEMKEICSLVPNPCCKDTGQCGNTTCIDWTQSLYDMEYPGIGLNLIFFAVSGIIFFVILLFCLEIQLIKMAAETITSICRSKKDKTLGESDDDDVLKEKQNVNQIYSESKLMEYNLVLRNLRKFYGSFLAVGGISAAVSGKECFGLLGLNGAGKSTTFKMLIGDEKISYGDAYVKGLSIKSKMRKVHQHIGYCPQFDALLDELTGYETLKIFCLIRGIQNFQSCIQKWGEKMLFTEHIHKRVKEYSGGNKRKLSTAIAMIGDPAVVLLDEPTAGMDPVARRHVWNVISSVRDQGASIILTSHSMEECEALCTRLAIMVNGRFQCIGSTQHLKNKFAAGVTVTVKLKKLDDINTADHVQSVDQFINSTFKNAIKKEEHDIFLTYYIQNPNLPWSRIFGIMEKAKKGLDIEDYSVGQTSLEQVFLGFAKHQAPEIRD